VLAGEPRGSGSRRPALRFLGGLLSDGGAPLCLPNPRCPRFGLPLPAVLRTLAPNKHVYTVRQRGKDPIQDHSKPHPLISHSLKLELFNSGVREDFDIMLEGFVDIELPPTEKNGPKGRMVIYGSIKHTKHDARESACKNAVKFLCNLRKVTVRDVNYKNLKKTNKKLMAAEFWSDAFQAKSTEVLKSYAEANNRFALMEQQLKDVLTNFLDVLHVEQTVITKGAGKPNQFIFQYNGPPGYPTRMDQLGLALLQLLQGPKKEEDQPHYSPDRALTQGAFCKSAFPGSKGKVGLLLGARRLPRLAQPAVPSLYTSNVSRQYNNGKKRFFDPAMKPIVTCSTWPPRTTVR
ncbi:hypothetical protein EJB05_11379, partial [Eragrostis curvula]